MIGFDTRLDFTGKHVIAYSQNVNSCRNSISFGLWADDIIKYFSGLIKRSIPQRFNRSPKFPYRPPELASELMKSPMCTLFNTIFITLNDRMKKIYFYLQNIGIDK